MSRELNTSLAENDREQPAIMLQIDCFTCMQVFGDESRIEDFNRRGFLAPFSILEDDFSGLEFKGDERFSCVRAKRPASP
ncbi:hypothetical protein D3C80_1532910 [compost metagenome]